VRRSPGLNNITERIRYYILLLVSLYAKEIGSETRRIMHHHVRRAEYLLALIAAKVMKVELQVLPEAKKNS
jgi:hypothetical protein